MKFIRIELSFNEVLELSDPKYRIVQYAIMHNHPLDALVKYHVANPDVFIFPFLSGNIDDISDYSGLKIMHNSKIMQPIYIGKEINEADVQKYIDETFAGLKKCGLEFHKVHTEYYTTEKGANNDK